MSRQSPAPGLTEVLADHVCDPGRRPDDAALDLAETAMVDTIGVALAAVGDPAVTSLLAAVGLGTGSSTVLVSGDRTDARDAALIGGTAAHALDFDDVDDAMIGHPSAVLGPTVLAVGEQTDASGYDVLDAYWTGLTTARAVALALDVSGHYALGWHSTATIGALAAAAAASRLRRLPRLEVRHALGVAGSLAAGSRQNFGTMTKPLHAGTAAANGVFAASLAAAGFTADPQQLERPLGFLALHGGRVDERRPADGLAAADPELNRAALNVKLHPCCYYIHPAADAALALAASGPSADDVDSVTVTLQPDALAPLIHHRPQTGLQGKFSLEYAMAACLLDRRLSLSTFTDEQVRRPDAQRLIPRVHGETADTPPSGPSRWDGSFAVVTVRMLDGQELTQRVDRARGHAERPLTEQELRDKFADCLRFGGFSDTDGLYPSLRGLRTRGSVREVTRGAAAVAERAPAVSA